jgi:thiol-disulfide isomerase/thioredoxin
MTKIRAPRLSAVALVLFALQCAGGASAAELKPWRGGATPPLQLKDLEGNPHRLADYRGSVVLVNFWATWCGPCRDEMPSIQQLERRLAGKPFVVLAVNVAESEARIADFLRQMPLDFTVLRDHSSESMRAWQVRVLPASFVIAPDGRIRYSFLGGTNWDDDAVARAIMGLMPYSGAVQARLDQSSSAQVRKPAKISPRSGV